MSGFGFTPTTTTASAGFSFASPITTTAQAQPSSSFSFGVAPNTSSVQPTGLGFGGTQPVLGSTTQSSGFGFGTNAPASSSIQPQLQGFGSSPAATTSAAPTSGFSFGSAATSTATTQPSGGFNFGGLQSTPPQPPTAVTTSSAAPAFTGFGLKTTTTASTGFSFGAPTTTTAVATGLTFGTTSQQPIATTSASLSFGTTTTTATLGSSLGGGLFAAKPATTSTLPTLGGGFFGAGSNQAQTIQSTTTGPNLIATSIAPSTSVGLGGVDLNSTQPKSAEGKQDIKVKDIIIPQPIKETVENLKNFIKQQKSISSDIARSTIRKLQNVSSDIKTLEWSLQDMSNCVEKNYGQIKSLRIETSKAIQSVEMAQRTHETPVGLQFENIMPLQYFQELVQKYEADMIAFRNQVELTEKHMRSLTCPQSFSPEDLKRGLQQIHESFIALAGRLHEIHQKVETQKEQYLNLRKYYLRDATNVFAELENNETALAISNISSGPTPFSSLNAATGLMWQAANRSNANATQQNNLGGNFGTSTTQTSANTGFGFGLSSNLSSGFQNTKPLFGSTAIANTPSFNLQNPPAAGAKRNKQ